MSQKCQKQAEVKRDDVINQQNYNFNQFLYGKFCCSQKATNQPKSNVELFYMCPRGLTGPPAVKLIKKYKKRLLLRCTPFYIGFKSISVHPLLWMNVILDFICMVFAELLSTGYKRISKIQNYVVCLRRESNQRPLTLQRVPLTMAIVAVDDMS